MMYPFSRCVSIYKKKPIFIKNINKSGMNWKNRISFFPLLYSSSTPKRAKFGEPPFAPFRFGLVFYIINLKKKNLKKKIRVYFFLKYKHDYLFSLNSHHQEESTKWEWVYPLFFKILFVLRDHFTVFIFPFLKKI